MRPEVSPEERIPEASYEELPAVLARPPWLDPPPKVALTTMELQALPFEERVSMPPEHRAFHAAPEMSLSDLQSWNKVPGDLRPRTPQMDAFVSQTLTKPTRYGTSYLFLMSDAAAWAYLEANGVAHMLAGEHDLKHLFARFGPRVLPVIARSGSGVDLSEVFDIESARIAAAMAQAFVKGPKAARERAQQYFVAFPEASAIGVIPLALAKKTQKKMLLALQAVAADGRTETVRTVASRYGDDVRTAVDALLSYQGPPRKPPVLPAWYRADALPPVALRATSKRLPASAIAHLGTLLALCEPDAPHPGLAEVKAACTPASLAAFAWAVFTAWLDHGAEPAHDWALSALGHLGDDEVARQLAPLVRAWPGEAAHARAVKGLDALAGIGSDIALMHLDGIAEKVKFRALQDRAREKIEAIAEQRALSRDELADRIAPTLGLDRGGSRALSFGARTFRVGFDEHLAPFVVDDGNERLGDLPKPRATDDAGAAAEAVASWKALKKDARNVAANQIQRLERAICTQRRWSAGDFRTLLLDHPLIFHLVRRLVWATYRDTGPDRLFRVAEDRTFADVDDAPWQLPDDARVGLVHPLELSAEAAQRWGTVLADYEILQPFAQLGRDVYTPTVEERGSSSITRMERVEVSTRRMLGLEARGWRRGTPGDGGTVTEMLKALGGGLWAELPFEDGMYAGSIAESPDTQTLGAVVLRKGPEWSDARVPIAALSAVMFSELVRDLESLRV